MNQQHISLLLDFNTPFDLTKIQILDQVVSYMYSKNHQMVSRLCNNV